MAVHLFGCLPKSPVTGGDLSFRQMRNAVGHTGRHVLSQHSILVSKDEEDGLLEVSCLQGLLILKVGLSRTIPINCGSCQLPNFM